MEVNVREARTKISSLLDRAEMGEEVTIIRRGKRIARLVSVGDVCTRLPNLREFRDSILVKGKSLSATVIQGREEERY
jgi:prevent-host-death family protein